MRMKKPNPQHLTISHLIFFGACASSRFNKRFFKNSAMFVKQEDASAFKS